MKILVPIDGSKFSQLAIDFICSRQTLIGSDPQITLLNVQPSIPPHAQRALGQATCDAFHREEAEQVLAPAAAALATAGVKAKSLWQVGRPSEKIAQLAELEGVDLILLGSHGHGALTGLVLGSTTSAMMARTSKPVLLLRDETRKQATNAFTVGVAVDGSAYGLQAAQFVLNHTEFFAGNTQFKILHAVPDFAGAVMPDMAGIALPAFSAEEIKAMQDKAFEAAVAPVKNLFEQHQANYQSVRLSGNAGDAIANYADRHSLDVLVMGSHGYGAFKSAVLGSVARRVAASCKTPLLLVRQAT